MATSTGASANFQMAMAVSFEEAHFWLVEFFHLHVDHGYKVFDLIPGINEIVVGKLLAVDGDALVDMFKMR